MREVTEGTIIHGTLRPQDLLPEFLATAIEIDQDRTLKSLEIILPDMRVVIYDDDHPWWESDECGEAINGLVDLLCSLAPEGYAFGAHPGDGSDFGFWPDDLDVEYFS